jgi:hypothetical protein
MDLTRLTQGIAHGAAAEVRSAGPIQDELFASQYEIDRFRKSAHGVGGNNDRTVNVCVDDVVMTHEHAEDCYIAVYLDQVHMSVARSNPSANDLEARR